MEGLVEPPEDGISIERNAALLLKYLDVESNSDDLHKFLEPDLRHLNLDYHQDASDHTNEFVHLLLDSPYYPLGSSWSLQIIGKSISDKNLVGLTNLIRTLPSIVKFEWKSSSIPLQILATLTESHPTTKLYCSIRYNDYNKPECIIDEFEGKSSSEEIARQRQEREIARKTTRERIINSSILYSLTIDVSYGGVEDTYSMDLAHRIITSCPNVRELALSISHYGCVMTHGPQPYAFNFRDRDLSFPPLEVLDLSGYGLGDKPDGNRWMEWEASQPKDNILFPPWKWLPQSVIDIVGYEKIKDLGGLEPFYVKRDTSALKKGEKTNLDIWLEMMDWSHLHTLHLSYPDASTLMKLTTSLPSLRTVSFNTVCSTDATIKFISDMTSLLRSITLQNILTKDYSSFVNAITKHPTLTTLRLNNPTLGLYYYSRPNAPSHSNTYLTRTHLRQISSKCPHLAELDIDMETTPEWNYPLINTLSSISSLTHLTLRFEKERNGLYPHDEMLELESITTHNRHGSSWQETDLSMNALASYLKKKSGPGLVKVEIWVGGRKVATPEKKIVME